LHVGVPISRRASWVDLKTFVKAFADTLVREQPSRYIAQSSMAKRAGNILLDHLRNEKGATAVASYPTRARSGATVATPISWQELADSLLPGQFTVQSVPERLRTMKPVPWRRFFEVRQTLTRNMEAQINKW
jgi:bifunctional non-homologous end joining protein LigD